ncbi:hypothetical protein BGW39_003374 [Mortierella sp. 14UC]|nr:hypothetical protein BGW39_003374 [Mortierella sp. 14UC]
MALSARTAMTALPPLVQLTHFTTCMTSYPTDKVLPQVEHQHQTLWLVRLNAATLTYLHLSQLDPSPPRVLRDLARTISQLCRLKTLRLELVTENTLTRQY